MSFQVVAFCIIYLTEFGLHSNFLSLTVLTAIINSAVCKPVYFRTIVETHASARAKY